MKMRFAAADSLLAVIVLVHLGLTLVHGAAHVRARVALSRPAMAFVFIVILIGPLLGLLVQALAWPRIGAWVVAAALGGAFVFGLANHFLIPGVDHVSRVAGPWQGTFGVTAVLLAMTEALGSAVAVRCATDGRR